MIRSLCSCLSEFVGKSRMTRQKGWSGKSLKDMSKLNKGSHKGRGTSCYDPSAFCATDNNNGLGEKVANGAEDSKVYKDQDHIK